MEREIQELTDRLAEAIKVNIDLQKEIEESYSIRKKVCINLHVNSAFISFSTIKTCTYVLNTSKKVNSINCLLIRNASVKVASNYVLRRAHVFTCSDAWLSEKLSAESA